MAEFSQDTKQLSPSGMPILIESNSHFLGMWSNAADVQQITDIKVVFSDLIFGYALYHGLIRSKIILMISLHAVAPILSRLCL